MKKALEAASKLTQVQKTYLVKRIDAIKEAKILAINKEYDIHGTQPYYFDRRHTYYQGYNQIRVVRKNDLSTEVYKALVKGKVKLKTKKDILAAVKLEVEKQDRNRNGSYGGSTRVEVLDFIDKDSLHAFNNARNDDLKATEEKRLARLEAVVDEGDTIKDKVMLDGSGALKLLEDFESKTF